MIPLLVGRTFIFALLPALLLSALLLSDKGFDRPEKKIFLKYAGAGLLLLLPTAFVLFLFTLLLKNYIPEGNPLHPFVSAALIEEAAKLCLIYILLKKRAALQTTGLSMTYGGAVAIGFASGETMLYLTGTAAYTSLFIVRGITALPLHTLCGTYMGLQINKSRKKEENLSPLAFFLPYLLHGTYNSLLRLPGAWPYMVIPLLAVSLYLLFKIKGKEKNRNLR